MKLNDSGSMNEYIKKMTEIFTGVIAEPVSDEDKVVYLLVGLSEGYDVLVTALECGSDTVPALELVTEHLLREEQKQKDREDADDSKKLLVANSKGSLRVTIVKDQVTLRETAGSLLNQAEEMEGAETCIPKQEQPPTEDAMVISNALVARSRNDWIVDSGATSHMCNECSMFTEYKQLGSEDKVTLGDRRTLKVAGEGTVDMLLDDGTRRSCALKKVLYVPKLAYNLVSLR